MTDEPRLYDGAIGERLLEITILSHLRDKMQKPLFAH